VCSSTTVTTTMPLLTNPTDVSMTVTQNEPVSLTSRQSDDEFNFGQSPPRHRVRSSTPPPPPSAATRTSRNSTPRSSLLCYPRDGGGNGRRHANWSIAASTDSFGARGSSWESATSTHRELPRWRWELDQLSCSDANNDACRTCSCDDQRSTRQRAAGLGCLSRCPTERGG